MATVITPGLLFFGAPTSLTVDGDEAGTMFEAPKITVEYETNADKIRPQGARGPIKGLLHIKSAICKAVFRVYEFSATTFSWALPGSSVTGSTQITVQPAAGRMPSSAYKNVVMLGVGIDGLPLRFELDDAISVVNQDIPFSDDDWSSFLVELTAMGDPEHPELLPWRWIVG
jgi:hypothetical protein